MLSDQRISVDGKWGAWSKYSMCSKPCGGGTQKKSRKCNNPSPAHLGYKCYSRKRERVLDETFTRSCNSRACPGNGINSLVPGFHMYGLYIVGKNIFY